MYDRPQLYDDAFSYRDFTAEVGAVVARRCACSLHAVAALAWVCAL